MINLAVREVTHTWFRYFLTAFGLGLLGRTHRLPLGPERPESGGVVYLSRERSPECRVGQQRW